MSYLRYHRILLIGIIVEKCVENHSMTLTCGYVKPCRSNNVPFNRETCSKVYPSKNRKSYTRLARKEEKKTGHVKNGFGKELTIAETVITYLGLDMLGNVSIDSHPMMDCVLK